MKYTRHDKEQRSISCNISPKLCLPVDALALFVPPELWPCCELVCDVSCRRRMWLWCMQVLEKHGLSVSVRITRGLDVAAACGQLRNAHQKQALSDFPQLE